MNFQNLQKVETAEFYLDVAFRRAKEAAGKKKGSRFNSKMIKSKELEKIKLETVKQVLNSYFNSIIVSYPSLEELSPFYFELLRLYVDIDDLKQSLGAVNWVNKKVNDFYNIYNRKLQLCTEISRMNDYRREFYGRVSSFVKQGNDDLIFFEQAKKFIKGLPTLKNSLKTIAIMGFPNVGKTTLLYKLTGSKPEIKEYAFTTKGVNIGYFRTEKERLQMIDTPGTLARFDKMNDIEKIAVLVAKYLAEKFIYVFDLTEASYPLSDQIRLFNDIKGYNKEIIVYLSKTDIIDLKKVKEFKLKNEKMITDVAELAHKLSA